jgi:putative transposase
MAGISKQALHQHNKRQLQSDAEQQKFFEKADAIRKEHPGAGCRKMAQALRCSHWGRDKIETLLLKNGYRLQFRRNYAKTTRRQRRYPFPNLIEGMELNDINQVVQTDITYYCVNGRFYYLTFIIDVYSRLITGFAVSGNLEAEANIRALEMMLKTRRGHQWTSFIHHSDKGCQYIEKRYLKLLHDNNIRISMCDQAWQNPYAERLHKTIKEEYLYKWRIKNYRDLKNAVAKAVDHYNTKRSHLELNRTNPVAFEKIIQSIPLKNRPKMKLFGP